MQGNRVQEFYYLVKSKIREKLNLNPVAKNSHYMGTQCLGLREMNDRIASMIESGEPFMVTRFGGTELFSMRTVEFSRKDSTSKPSV